MARKAMADTNHFMIQQVSAVAAAAAAVNRGTSSSAFSTTLKPTFYTHSPLRVGLPSVFEVTSSLVHYCRHDGIQRCTTHSTDREDRAGLSLMPSHSQVAYKMCRSRRPPQNTNCYPIQQRS
ncbi:hypothetical protein PTI98_004363 [Pleurotus ostreatus]|nr:hypothetical protein PTI98_004363 [Pleurotus ostreatus]